MSLPNAMSCDLEDYFQVQNCASIVPREAWAATPSRLEASTDRVLALFAEAGIQATFFVLGWNAERHPALVRRIAAAGHEIASHGYGHRMIVEQTPEEFRQDVTRSKALLEDLAGQPVLGYRAPTFSITERSLWALAILAEAGYRYDSSIFPIRHDRYGIPNAPRFLHELSTANGQPIADRGLRIADCGSAAPKSEIRNPKSEMAQLSDVASNGARIIEFPPTTARLLGCNVPVAGGGYLRLFPVRLIAATFRRANRRGHPVIVYFHPWELDPGQPRLPMRGLSRFRHYVNLGRTADKLRCLLRCLPFTTAQAVIEQWKAEADASASPANEEDR